MFLIIITFNNVLNVLVGDVHRVDEIIPDLDGILEQLILEIILGLLLFRGQGLLNFLKLLI